jgi:nitrate/nitrite transport system substrate-binding protein
VARQINQIDALQAGRQRAEDQRAQGPDMRTSKLIDGVVWDGKNPAKYADGFKINA